MRLKCEDCGKTFPFPAKKTETAGNIIYETPICPCCNNLHIAESHDDITEIQSVPIEEANSWIAKGYSVEAMFAKTVTLVKKKEG